MIMYRVSTDPGLCPSPPYLQRDFDERFSVVGENEMIVRNAVADGIVGADDVDERREKRQRVTILGGSEIRDPLVRLRVRVRHLGTG